MSSASLDTDIEFFLQSSALRIFFADLAFVYKNLRRLDSQVGVLTYEWKGETLWSPAVVDVMLLCDKLSGPIAIQCYIASYKLRRNVQNAVINISSGVQLQIRHRDVTVDSTCSFSTSSRPTGILYRYLCLVQNYMNRIMISTQVPILILDQAV